ncbi:hypothetical protein [Lelliottia amnigena]|uniref:hypothetical protein n=2 Tax=Lelliottia TaxID=1330545 RepID=UPI001FAEEDC7|nr:hypothetical protein [Lelliottia amnigena]MCU7784394.1 hypothetical protein [Lelliottia amnigena]USR59948.1 hypothetical protein NFJ01_17005 [Lelliottia amnigena]
MMNSLTNSYISMFTERSVYIKNAVNRCLDYWAPEQAPLILLFSVIGKSLVNQFNMFNDADKAMLFQHIEDGMLSNDDDLATAVATGLVESLVNASDGNDELWGKIVQNLGIESQKHAIAWRNFGQ